MDLRDARTLNAEELYDRRKQAILLHKKGTLTQAGIGEVVGVRRDVVGRWIKLWKQGGLKALKPSRNEQICFQISSFWYRSQRPLNEMCGPEHFPDGEDDFIIAERALEKVLEVMDCF